MQIPKEETTRRPINCEQLVGMVVYFRFEKDAGETSAHADQQTQEVYNECELFIALQPVVFKRIVESIPNCRI